MFSLSVLFTGHQMLNIGTCLSELDRINENIFPLCDNIVFMGDLNINFQNKNSTAFNFLSNILIDYNMTQLTEIDTTVSNSSSSTIDIVCVNDKIKVVKKLFDILID